MRLADKSEPFWSFLIRNHMPGERDVIDVVSAVGMLLLSVFLAAGVAFLLPHGDLRFIFFAIVVPAMVLWKKIAYERGKRRRDR